MASKKSTGVVSSTQPEGPARIRVYTRTGDGKRVPMVGLIPREAIESIRDLLAASPAPAGQRRLTARVRSLEAVQVRLEDGKKTPARRLVLTLSVKDARTRSQVVREELDALLREAERIKDAAVAENATVQLP